MQKSLIICFWVMASFMKVHAQQFKTAFEEIQKIRNSYSDTGYSSFTVHYQYAKQSAPNVMGDTLSAVYKYKGQKIYFNMRGIEFAQDDSFSVTTYQNEQVMVIGNIATQNTISGMPFQQWDSSFLKLYIDSVALSDKANIRMIQFYFKPSVRYKSCLLEYDPKNYQPQKISFVQKSIKDTENASPVEEEIVVVTMLFAEYSKEPFSDLFFNTQKFVQKLNGSWTAMPAYSNYKLINNYISNSSIK